MFQPIDRPDLAELVQRQRAFFLTDATRPKAWRMTQLTRLEGALRDYEGRFLEALKEDLGKSPEEAFGTELGLVLGEVKLARKKLAEWMKPRKLPTPKMLFPGRSYERPEPLGVSLIVAPWNYPVQLSFVPLIAALSAGCTSVIKPSEHAPACAKLIEELVQAHFEPSAVTVVQGGPEVSEALTRLHWDTIFFTGSTQVGRKVAAAAATSLTPVTLELGGKSPCIVTADADLEVSARRIAWGKAVNAGQSCVAPDYLLVDRRVKAPLIEGIVKNWRSFFGDDPSTSPDYGRVVNAHHFRRLESLLSGGKIVHGGERDAEKRYIAPTLLDEVDLESPLMQEEIFGPLLPIIEIDGVEDALRFVRARPRPLALYIFSSSEQTQEHVIAATSSGGVVINDTLMHVASAELPFGGVGQSGMGRSHGRAGFENFSHRKSVLSRPIMLDFRFRYPPLAGRLNLLKKLVG